MPRKTFVLIIAVLLLCILKFMGVEFQRGQAEAASSLVTASLKSQKTAKQRSPQGSIVKETTPVEKQTRKTEERGVHSLPRRITQPEAYCRLLAAGVDLEDVDIKLSYIGREYAEPGEVYLVAFVHTDSCPRNTHSIYGLDKDNRILHFTDCHDSTMEDMALQSASQNQIVYLGPTKNRVNTALSGPGMFVLQCKDGFYYSRRGDWKFNSDGSVSTHPENCQVLDRQGRAFHMNNESDLNDQGCNSQGECLAVARLEEGGFKVLDRETFLATTDPLKSLLPESTDVKFFVDYLEDLNNRESGVMGPEFESMPYFNKPPWCPESFD